MAAVAEADGWEPEAARAGAQANRCEGANQAAFVAAENLADQLGLAGRGTTVPGAESERRKRFARRRRTARWMSGATGAWNSIGSFVMG